MPGRHSLDIVPIDLSHQGGPTTAIYAETKHPISPCKNSAGLALYLGATMHDVQNATAIDVATTHTHNKLLSRNNTCVNRSC